MRRFSILASVLVFAALALLPLTSDLGLMNVMIKVFIASIFALGFNLLWGQAGLLSFGHAAYFGLGTFGSIYLMNAIDHGARFPTPLVPLAGAAIGFAFGLVAGWFATIRSGVYFAMITVALAELVSAISLKWDSAFGGEAGIRSVRSPWGPFGFQSTSEVYYLILLWTTLVIVFLLWLQRSPWGLIVRGIREREERVRFLGYNSHAVKTLVFAISAGLSGLAGGLLALSDESANMVLFQGSGSAFVVLNTVIGGATVFAGPIVGAALTTVFSYYIAGVTQYWLLYLGVLFIFLVLYAPTGLAGLVAERALQVRCGEKTWLSRAELLRFAGLACLLVGFILAIELTGAVLAPEYAAQTAMNAGVHPAVRILGLDWHPTSPISILAIILLFAGGIVLMRGNAGGGGLGSARVGRLIGKAGQAP
jgi:branched-chain amino acid transport system permease protein